MENTIDSVPALDDVWKQIGNQLKEARIQRHIAIADVADYLKISVRKVEALENAQLDQLPAVTFTKGFARSYAKLLQLDITNLLDQISTESKVEPHPDMRMAPRKIVHAYPSRSSTRFVRKLLLSLLLMALLTLGFLGLRYLNSRTTEATDVSSTAVNASSALAVASIDAAKSSKDSSTTADAKTSSVASQLASNHATEDSVKRANISAASLSVSNTVVASDKATAVVPAKQTAKVAVQILGDTWLQVLNKSGKIISDQSYQAGQKEELTVDIPAQIIVGDVKSVQLQYQGKRLPLMSNHGVGFAEIKE